MKKIYFIFSILLLLSFDVFSCGFTPETFCKSLEIQSENYIISGKIISIDDDGLDLEIIDVLRGEESKSIIRIWDGTDFECNGNWSMDCSTIGEINESVILLLPKITEIENTWDVIGDYRRPNPYSYISQLKLEDGIAEGLIAGDAIAPDEFNTLSIEYDKLKETILTNGDCEDLTSSTKALLIDNDLTYNNPVNTEINLQFDDLILTQVNIYTINGTKVESVPFNNRKSVNIPFENRMSGLYILEIFTLNNHPKYIKIIKR